MICTFVFIGFVLGISQYPTGSFAPFLGVTAGLFSAFCWGCTGISFARWNIGEIEGTTGLFNIAAAILAAAAVGYLAPQEACTAGPAAPFRDFVCSFYRNAQQSDLAAPVFH